MFKYDHLFLSFLSFLSALANLLTTFIYSSKKALMILCLTHPGHSTPP